MSAPKETAYPTSDGVVWADLKDLSPCPFCGAEPIWDEWEDGSGTIMCVNDDCLVQPELDHGESAEERRDAWNTRAPIVSASETEREAIWKALRKLDRIPMEARSDGENAEAERLDLAYRNAASKSSIVLNPLIEALFDSLDQIPGGMPACVEDAASALSSALRTPAQPVSQMQGEWRSIKSAPKDGATVDLWMLDETGKGWREANAYYVQDEIDLYSDYETGSHRQLSVHRDGWFAPGHGYDGDANFCDQPVRRYGRPLEETWIRATHWMPLPAAPSPESEAT